MHYRRTTTLMSLTAVLLALQVARAQDPENPNEVKG